MTTIYEELAQMQNKSRTLTYLKDNLDKILYSYKNLYLNGNDDISNFTVKILNNSSLTNDDKLSFNLINDISFYMNVVDYSQIDESLRFKVLEIASKEMENRQILPQYKLCLILHNFNRDEVKSIINLSLNEKFILMLRETLSYSNSCAYDLIEAIDFIIGDDDIFKKFLYTKLLSEYKSKQDYNKANNYYYYVTDFTSTIRYLLDYSIAFKVSNGNSSYIPCDNICQDDFMKDCYKYKTDFINKYLDRDILNQYNTPIDDSLDSPFNTIVMYKWFEELVKYTSTELYNKDVRYTNYKRIIDNIKYNKLNEKYIDLVKLIYACSEKDLKLYIKKNKAAALAPLYNYDLSKCLDALKDYFNDIFDLPEQDYKLDNKVD